MITVNDGNLSDVMQFDHVIRIKDGEIFDDVINVYSPECYHDYFGDDKHIHPDSDWVLLEGFTGQHAYRGPVMHESEYIGGGLAEYILENDGYYVAIACEVIECDDDCTLAGEECVGDHDPAGWCVAYLEPTDGVAA